MISNKKNCDVQLTIITTIFNRANFIKQLFENLDSQDNNNFKWLIVDDGSTDDIAMEFDKFSNKYKCIDAKLLTQSNSGKHVAINRAVDIVETPYLVILDSDDAFAKNAVSLIYAELDKVIASENIGVLSFLGGNNKGDSINTFHEECVCSHFDYQYKYNGKGDRCEVLKTDILKNHRFPEFEGERFCPEALVWNRIAKTFMFKYIPAILILKDYQPGGLTSKIVEIRMKSPIAACTYYSELSHSSIPLTAKLKATINYWRFQRYIKSSEEIQKPHFLLSLFAFPISFLMSLKDKIGC